MYSITGKRHIPELTLDWLPGYEGSAPVRVGQRRGGPVPVRRLRRARRRRLPGAVLRDALAQLTRGGRGTCRNSSPTSSNSAGGNPTRASGRCAASPSTSRTRRSWPGSPSTGSCGASGSSDSTGTSTGGSRSPTRSTPTSARTGSTRHAAASPSHYGTTAMDASLLMIPLVGFLPPDDPRIVATVHAVDGTRPRRRAAAALPDGRDPRRTAG